MHTNLVVSLEKSCISLQHTPLLVGPTTSTMFFHNSSSSTEVVNLCKQCVDDLSSSFFSVCNWWELASALAPSMFRVTVLSIEDVRGGRDVLYLLPGEVVSLYALLFTNAAPHWAPKSVTDITIFSVLQA